METSAREYSIDLWDGAKIAVKDWGSEKADVNIIATHGYLDNAATWDTLAPLLVSSKELKIRLVAMDFIGHGMSSHGTSSSYTVMSERVMDIIGVADALRWDSFHLMGHSMGANISVLVAGAFPQRIKSLILVEGLGPLSGTAAPAKLEKAIKERPSFMKRQRRIYTSFDEILQRYKSQNDLLSERSVRLLLKRGVEEVLTEKNANEHDSSSTEERVEKGYCFRHDPRQVGSYLQSYSEEQLDEFFNRIPCKVLVLLAANELGVKKAGSGWIELMRARVTRLKDAKVERIQGEHHVHLDSPEVVCGPILDYLQNAQSAKL